MRADFVNEVARILRIERKDLIEKDLILHQILTDLSNADFFASNFLFKGGTCLIKSYFGYRRFSEDVDFTWKNQTKFSRMSQKRIRLYLSKVIDKTGDVFEDIARRRGFDFKCDKRNPDYVEFGGGNKTCTLKIWYQSEVLNRRSFLKVQINFVESMCFPPKNGQLEGLLTGKHEELQALFPEEYGEYSRRIRFGIYDVREILSEKVRAILTREGIKARDFVDVFFICRQFGIKVERMEPCIVKKTNFALKLYSKYRRNLREKIDLLQSGKLFEWGEERTLLLSDINETDFYLFVEEFEGSLRQVVRSLNFQL